jgi:hypothetical protein
MSMGNRSLSGLTLRCSGQSPALDAGSKKWPPARPIAGRDRATRRTPPSANVTRIAKLAFVSRVVAEAVVGGRAPAGVNLQMLMDGRVTLPLDWNDSAAASLRNLGLPKQKRKQG